MRYKLFGPTGLRVSELALGTMTFGEDWGWGSSREESKEVFDVYVEAGGNFLDTANFYTNGNSERIVGELVRGRRDDFVIATKYSLTSNPKDPNGGGNHRKSLMRSLDASLERLGTSYIDIFWVHAWDALTPVEEVMRGLDDAVRSGRVHYVGLSDAPAWYLAKANTLAELRGWTAFAGLQMQYNLLERSIEREILPYAEAHGLVTTAWSPLGGGMLTGKYGYGTDRRAPTEARHDGTGLSDYFLTDRSFEIARVVADVARATGASMARVALAWLRQTSPSIIPVLGARKTSQLRDNLGCLDLRLDAEHMQLLDAVSRIEMGFPRDFLSIVSGAIHGETRDRIDAPRA